MFPLISALFSHHYFQVFPSNLGFKFMVGKKKIMAQHGAWRERRRTLEAEGSALAETLRNLVASNATLKAKYAAELRALTKEDFTIGADVVARWNNY
jgi:hypothetical protein